MSDVRVPDYGDVLEAARRMAGWAVATPLIDSPVLDERSGARILIKAEVLQRTGAFKFRGAWNRISRLDDAERRKGVVAYSSGNHGQAVAAAARLSGVAATVVMPRTAPDIKIESTRRHGAEIVLYDPETESRESIAERLAAETGAIVVPPFDDPHIIAGQGTVGLEIADQADALGTTVDLVLVPCSGGGLIAGCAIALKERFPDAEIYAVEPVGFDDTARSLSSGKRETIAAGAFTFCDALRVPTPGEITFAINRRLLAGGLVVSDGQTGAAMRTAFRDLKLVVEPGGAIALAAALSGIVPVEGRTVAIVCSGGNVDAATFADVLSQPD
jgi:threonine dehydratase